MTQGNEGRPRTPEELKAEIAGNRAAVQHDIKAIGEKFTPQEIKESAKGVLADAKREGATMIRDTKDKALESARSVRDNAVDTASHIAHEASEIAHQVGDRARDAGIRTADYARRAGTATGDFVTTNAIPLSLIGLGVGWLALSLRRSREDALLYDNELGYEYSGIESEHRVGRVSRQGRAGELAHNARVRAEELGVSARERAVELAGSARERAVGLADGARERAGAVADSARNLAHSARDHAAAIADRANQSYDATRVRVVDTASQLGQHASELSHEARERLHRAQLRTRDYADENPLAVGAIAIAAGVGVGLLLPRTQPENRLMGDTRDRLVEDARGLIQEARDTGSRVGQSAREAAQELRGSVRDARISH
ncbi:MAG: DUF3618 domain-containing protein [Polyangiales bacterium]